jgi:hypothetical protein
VINGCRLIAKCGYGTVGNILSGHSLQALITYYEGSQIDLKQERKDLIDSIIGFVAGLAIIASIIAFLVFGK